MGGDSSVLRVFVSSTSEDLKAHRAVARQMIGSLRWHAVMMEDFGASPTATVTACEQELGGCQLVLLILAFRKGWVPSGLQGGNDIDSITALELKHARHRGIPVLAMMANDNWKGSLYEKDDAGRNWVATFRSNLNLPAEFFGPEEDERLPAFRGLALKVLLAHQQRLLLDQVDNSSPSAASVDYSASAFEIVRDASSVPVIGQGVHGNGPLSSSALGRALGGTGDDLSICLATVAEYRERQKVTRTGFLNELCRIVVKQSREAAFPPAFRLLLEMPALPPLVIVTTYDLLFEEELTKSSRRHVVVTHVVRSADGEHDGKILVIRPGERPVVTPADKVDVGADECIVYRPLGSPLLHARLDPSWEIDTVVLTETDHVVFLSRLENEQTTVPRRFNRWLQRKPLLFLGYGLDLWNYRLFMHVFRVIGKRNDDAPVLAVRCPTSSMETASWERLGARLVPLDANKFVRRAMRELTLA